MRLVFIKDLCSLSWGGGGVGLGWVGGGGGRIDPTLEFHLNRRARTIFKGCNGLCSSNTATVMMSLRGSASLTSNPTRSCPRNATPSPTPRLRVSCWSLKEKLRKDPYRFTHVGPKVGMKPGNKNISVEINQRGNRTTIANLCTFCVVSITAFGLKLGVLNLLQLRLFFSFSYGRHS